MRLIWHENIDKSQKALAKFNKPENEIVTQTNTRVDALQSTIEADNAIDNNGKIKYLRGLNEVLVAFHTNIRYLRGMEMSQYQQLITAFSSALEAEKGGLSVANVIQENPLNIGEILLNSFAFAKNKGVAESRDILLSKSLELYPERILPTLQKNPNMANADSLIKKIAYSKPEDLYTYAQSTNSGLGKRIHAIDDPLIKLVSKLAMMNTGRLYFPFLDNLYRGKMTLEDVDKSMENKYKYYRLLVNTQIAYAGRMHNADTPLVWSTLKGMLKKKAVDDFINVINGLHDSPDNIRMKEVEPLNPQELYYLCVMGETEIYTSSYLKVYDRIFQRMKNPSGDSLLMSVNFDHFKKFIKVAAGYNTLDNFLKKMDKGNAEVLMKSFAAGLERTGNLEDAVDVADSYASISNQELRKLLLDEIKTDYDKLVVTGDRRGIVIYDILNNLFLSMDTANKIDISTKFGIPPVYTVSNASLKDTAGRIHVQQFFYGDLDGNTQYKRFLAAYSGMGWKVITRSHWTEVSSTKGTPITIYSNKPMTEENDEDAKAQAALVDYMDERGLNPTVVIHRGHSYYVQYTIDQLPMSAKVVLLGSCGGYHNIDSVLKISPYAHIIASKQVGSGTVNQPMMITLSDILRQGKDLNWPELWKQFGKTFKDNERFDDYVPPHKNLGAIFIMAYKKTLKDSKT
jgi:hypothetical protein